MSKVFFDTNILVYALDRNDPQKQHLARDLLAQAALEGNGVVSTQVMQEYYVTLTKKLGLNPLDAKFLMSDLENFEVVQVTPSVIREGINLSVLNRISFWDGLILAGASSAACSVLYTEDLNHGQTIDGVCVTNPF
jgi:predicted nucleic acid-binding protein